MKYLRINLVCDQLNRPEKINTRNKTTIPDQRSTQTRSRRELLKQDKDPYEESTAATLFNGEKQNYITLIASQDINSHYFY